MSDRRPSLRQIADLVAELAHIESAIGRRHSMEWFTQTTFVLSSYQRALVFDILPERLRSELWADVKQSANSASEEEREWDDYFIAAVPQKPEPVVRLRPVRGGGDRFDWLKSLHAIEYGPLLLGAHPDSAGYVRCPFHDDQRASLSLVGGNRTLWNCLACDAGGDVFHMGGLLWDLDCRRDFRQLKDRLVGELEGRAAA